MGMWVPAIAGKDKNSGPVKKRMVGMRHIFTITWFNRKDIMTRTTMRHLFCWLACLCFMAMPTMADKYFTIGDYRYFETDSIQKNVSVFSNSIDLEEIVIPEKVEYEGIEYNVTSIYPQAYMDHTEIKSVVIPSSVKSINYQAFQGCTNLTSVTIPKTVNFIGPTAFAKCSLLTSFDIPDSLKIIYEYTFKDCIRLVDASIPKSVTEIKSNAFHNCKLSSVTIPDSVTRIETSAFNGCQLSSVVVPKTVTYIGGSAFYGTDTIYYGGISSGSPWGAKIRKSYEYGDFSYADEEKENLLKYLGTDTAVTIPNNVKIIGDRAFQGNETLKSVTIPNSVTIIGEYAFSNCKKLSSINIPNSVKTIRKNAFANCERLTSINIPNSVTSLEEYAFSNCSGLTEVTISNSITTINNYTFRSCVGLTSITIPNSVKYINSSAFEGCTGLKSVEIPESVTSIGGNAFDGCRGLSSIVIPSSVTSIGFHALTGIDTLFYNGPANVQEWGEHTRIYGSIFDGDFVFANKEKTILAYYLGSDSSVIIPDYVENIQFSAFAWHYNLKTISIPNSVTTIGNSAFRGCSGLTYIKIPSSVTTIGDGAFSNASTIIYDGTAQGSSWGAARHIREAYFDGDFIYSDEHKENLAAYIGEDKVISIPKQVKTINENAFRYNKNISFVQIPDSVTSIGRYAFSECSLSIIFIPDSVTEIGKDAFYGINVAFYKGNATGSPWGANHRGISRDGDLIYEDRGQKELVAYIGTDSVVTIPDSIYNIGKNTFNGFETVYYTGTATGSPWGAKRHIKGDIFDGDLVYADEGKTKLVAYIGTDSVAIIPNSVTSIDTKTFNGFETVYYAGTATGSPWGAKRHIKGDIFDGDFVFADEAKTKLVAYIGTDSAVTISKSVTSIDTKTFNGFETVYYAGTATGSPWGAKRHIEGDMFDGDFVYADEGKTRLVAYIGTASVVVIPNSVTSIDANTFSGIETIYYAGTATGSPWGAKRHKRCLVDGDFIYADEGKTKLVAYAGMDSVVVIPKQVKTIGDSAFYGNTKITAVTFSDSVTVIGVATFKNCTSLSSLIVPNSVTKIGTDAFSGIDTVCYLMETDTILIIKDFYVIHNLQEFLTYRDINNKGYHPNARLDADIDLSPVCGIINGEIVNWETINLSDAMFDGGNHTITNLYINQSTGYVALIDSRHIENLIVKNAYVKGTYAAGITSCTSPLLLVNCHLEGVVIGTDFAGGLNLYGKASTLVNCSNYGLVVGGKNAADGIYAQKPINCYNRGRIVSNESTAKGVGMYCCCNPTNCYNAGAIISTEAYSIYEAYKSCFNLKIEGINLHDEETVQEMDSSAFLSGSVTDSLNKYVAQNPKTYDGWTMKDSIPLLPWVQGEDGFPRFEGVNLQPTQGYIVRFTGKVNNIDVSFDGTIDLPVCPVDGCTYVFSNDFDGKNIVSDTTVTVSQITDPNFLERDGDGFYLIHNGAELAKFRDVVNEGAVAINGRLANDIDLSQECKDSVWIPIGVYKNGREYIHMAYEGVFDGAGHSIEHLYNTITSSGYEGNSYKGLFAYTKNATIKNVAVKNSSLTAYFVAAIVAVAENTTIVNCGSEAKLYGPSDHGAAPICAISEGCRILNCYNIGDVKCEFNAMGFTNGGEEIINCYTSCVVLSEGRSSSRFGGGRVVYRCFADTVLSSGKYDYENKLVTMTSTDYIKSDAFLADMNAWVDSMNAAQSEIVFARWVRDEVDGYPKLQPADSSSVFTKEQPTTPEGISVYAVERTIYIRSTHAGKATLYDIHGKAVASVAYAEGITSVDGLQKGVYILCGAKVIVR